MSETKKASSDSLDSDSFCSRRTLKIGSNSFTLFSLKSAEKGGLSGISSLPYSLKILLENLLRNEDGNIVTRRDIASVSDQIKSNRPRRKIPFFPNKVLLNETKDFQAVIDLINDHEKREAGDYQEKPCRIPISRQLVVEQPFSISKLDTAATSRKAKESNFSANIERYRIIKWAGQNLENFQVVPPGFGTGQHLNLEKLSSAINTQKPSDFQKTMGMVNPEMFIHPETFISSSNSGDLLGGLSLLGWTEGTAAAKAVAFGEPIYVDIPAVIGIKISGKLGMKSTITDVALGILSALSKRRAKGKIIEFYGSAISQLSIEDRATISGQIKNSGALCGYFPIDSDTINFVRATRGSSTYAEILETYAKHQGFFRLKTSPDPVFSSKFEFNLSSVEPSVLGPKCSSQIITTAAASKISRRTEQKGDTESQEDGARYWIKGRKDNLADGDILIASIVASGNTANPGLMIGSGLLAKKAVELGLSVSPNVQTSFLTGSSVTSLYLRKSGLMKYLARLGFTDSGPSSLTLSGNATPLSSDIRKTIIKNGISAVGVHSGQNNLDDFLDETIKTNFATSPMLVIAYALCGTMKNNILCDPIGTTRRGNAIYLEDIWPSKIEIQSAVSRAIKGKYFRSCYENLLEGDDLWRKLEIPKSSTSLIAKNSKLVVETSLSNSGTILNPDSKSLKKARLIGLLGDNVSPETILPSGRIDPESQTGKFLLSKRVGRNNLGSYQDWASNAEAMVQDVLCFADLTNPKILVSAEHRGRRKKTVLNYASSNFRNPLILMAGKNFGAGPQNDCAARGLRLIGVKAIIAESFDEQCLQSLICEGLWPLKLVSKAGIKGLKLLGDEKINIPNFEKIRSTSQIFQAVICVANGKKRYVKLKFAPATGRERLYIANGGLVPHVHLDNKVHTQK